MILFLVACSSKSSKSMNIDYKAEAIEESGGIQSSKINNYKALSIQKLNEYFDLLKLQRQHPEFNSDIEAQLTKYTSQALITGNLPATFKVNEIKQIGEVQKVSDSVNKIQLSYNLEVNNSQIKDSIFAYCSLKTITINGQNIMSNKVRFSKK